MVTARVNNIKTVRVVLPDFERPDEVWIRRYDSIVKDLNCLAVRGISLDSVQDTLRWSDNLLEITLPEYVSANTLETLVAKLLADEAGGVAFTEDPIPGKCETAVIVDYFNREARASGLLLAQMTRVHFAESLNKIPSVLPQGQDLPESVVSVLVVCTAGAFRQPDFFGRSQRRRRGR